MSVADINWKESFDTNGFVKIPDFLSPEELSEITQNLDRLIRDIVPSMPSAHAFFEDKNDPGSLKQLFHLADYDPFFKKLASGSRFEKMAETLLGEKMAKGEVEYFNKPPGIGKPTPPHQDAYYFMLSPPQAVTFWVALEDVDYENGCLHYIPGSHLKGMRPHGKNDILGFSQCITDFGTEADRELEQPMPVKAGDILAHHGMTIHRAPGNQSLKRSRRVVGLVYFGESAREDLQAKEAYQEKLRQERLAMQAG
jgi:phytanoyl-CoA hydroxylase